MTGDEVLRRDGGERPLVAVLCSVPVLGEAVKTVVEFAEVHVFASHGDVAGLLQWLKPDAVVVDSDSSAADAAAFARGRRLPVLHLSTRERSLKLFRRGEWEEVADGGDPDPELLRNVLAGVLFAHGEVAP